MLIRKAKKNEYDDIYLMGFDTWGDDLPLEEYLGVCRSSKKYRAGTWYVLVDNEAPVSALIVYVNKFGLSEGCFGIGSVATNPQMRGNGFGSHLVTTVTKELLSKAGAREVFLHSDIGHDFYEKLGYRQIQNSDCMYNSRIKADCEGSIPSYF